MLESKLLRTNPFSRCRVVFNARVGYRTRHYLALHSIVC